MAEIAPNPVMDLSVNKAVRALLTEKGITVLAVRVEEEKALKCRIQHLGPARSKRPTAGAYGPRGGLGLPHRWEGSL